MHSNFRQSSLTSGLSSKVKQVVVDYRQWGDLLDKNLVGDFIANQLLSTMEKLVLLSDLLVVEPDFTPFQVPLSFRPQFVWT